LLTEHLNAILENTAKVQDLRKALEEQAQESIKTTYASVTAKVSKRQPQEQTLHSIIIASKDTTESGEEVMGQIREAVNAKEGWVTIDRVRKAKDRKVIVGCRTEKERDKVKERLTSSGRNLIVEEVKNKDPLLVLKEVLKYNTDDDIIQAIRKQNSDLFHDLNKKDDRIEVKYKKKSRNPHTHHVLRSGPSQSPAKGACDVRANDRGYQAKASFRPSTGAVCGWDPENEELPRSANIPMRGRWKRDCKGSGCSFRPRP
ncbi:unnamed protein product, partial [Arctia plantaginis]